MDYDPVKMRKRFHELKAKRDAQRAKADPIRAARDKVAVRHAKEIAKHNERVRAAEKGLFEIEQEMAVLVRAVGGKMGEPE
jgi:uncharacterized protein (DUF3084 family)